MVFSDTATTPVPEPELTVEARDRPTILEETVLYSVDDYYTMQPVMLSLSVSGGDHQTIVTAMH